MDNKTVVIIAAFFAVSVLVAIGVAIWLTMRQRRTSALRSKFGPEYNRMARAEGDTARAEGLLREREKRVSKFDIKPLTTEQRNAFADEWERVQGEFVDDPTAAVVHAHALVQLVMQTRGYPVVDFEQRVADVSVDHPAVAQNYRLAHDIATRNNREDVGSRDCGKRCFITARCLRTCYMMAGYNRSDRFGLRNASELGA